ncbi:MAG: hypothetical protein MJH10_20350 [Epibacterium sp.]|nr:hypothetical protein [Epibacterium sp.]NQX75821.1 hypothetical protein [Epibacterium sp.]
MTTQAELREKIVGLLKDQAAIHREDSLPIDGFIGNPNYLANAILALLPPAPAVGELIEALEWYASIYAWKGEYLGRDRHGLSEYDTSPASRDLGERARKALAALGEGGA